MDAAHSFITMELVEGVNFVEYVRSGGEFSRTRLVGALAQLVDGLATLHRAGKLHRDIKPSNMLVTAEGRVVILDFGLTSEVTSPSREWEGTLLGTPAYMAPELRTSRSATDASDWYAVGATLYEALTGCVPFAASAVDGVLDKAGKDPPAPVEISSGVPEELSAICMAMLCRDPAHRLSGQEALARLGLTARASPQPARPHRGAFVGRTAELRGLRLALDAAGDGHRAAVCIHGVSGIGKSALIRRFLDDVTATSSALVLAGRCYEHESVPYKALDTVIDSLSRYLASLPTAAADRLLPPGVPWLSRLFPAMLRVDAVASACGDDASVLSDPQRMRLLGSMALRDLLANIAAERRVAIWIDDLHWADADSLALLEDVLRPPAGPPLLAIVSFRSEEVAAQPFLQSLLTRASREAWTVMPLGPIAQDDARDLVKILTGATAIGDDEAGRIAREGNGNPFLIEQLAHHVATASPGAGPGVTLAEMLAARIAEVPVTGRAFLDTLALCARPVAPDLVFAASGLSGDARPLVALLRSAHLIRSTGPSGLVEAYHGQIGATIASQVAPERARDIHRDMASTLIASGVDDPEVLFEHLAGAGDSRQAAVQAERAAARADRVLAFDQAAAFYQRAIALDPASPSVSKWKERLGDALANAGRPPEAADAYLSAALDMDRVQQIELRRRGAEQLLVGGHIDRGMDVIRTVLGSIGLGVHVSPRTALLSLVARRSRLRWRGLRYAQRRVSEIPASDLLQVDACWSVMTGLALVDMVRAADFSTRHLLLALDAGEPYRIARGMATEAAHVAGAGGRNRERAADLLRRAQELAQRIDHPHALAVAALCDGICAVAAGRWKDASTRCGQALRIMRERSVGGTWELNTAQYFMLGGLLYQGEIKEVAAQLPELLAMARRRGNLYLEVDFVTRMNLVWLAKDDPDEGERQLATALDVWSQHGFHRQHFSALLARVQTSLYRGAAESAWQSIEAAWPALEKSFLLRVETLRVEACYLRARAALALAAEPRDRDRWLHLARQATRRIAAVGLCWSGALARLLGGAIAHLEGDQSRAVNELALAARGFDQADMKLYAAAARRRLAALGSAGAADPAREATDWMIGQDIVDPHRITSMLAPGFRDD